MSHETAWSSCLLIAHSSFPIVPIPQSIINRWLCRMSFLPFYRTVPTAAAALPPLAPAFGRCCRAEYGRDRPEPYARTYRVFYLPLRTHTTHGCTRYSTLGATEVRRLKTALWSMKGWCLGPSVVPL